MARSGPTETQLNSRKTNQAVILNEVKDLNLDSAILFSISFRNWRTHAQKTLLNNPSAASTPFRRRP